MRTKLALLIIGVPVCAMVLQGCTAMSLMASSKELSRQSAIRLQAQDGGAAVGVDMLRLDVLANDWPRHVVAALLDGVGVWGISRLADRHGDTVNNYGDTYNATDTGGDVRQNSPDQNEENND